MDYAKLSQKKRELDWYCPLPEALLCNLEDWFRVELTYTSNAIEGNTLSRQETALVVEKGLTVGGKSVTEHLEALNHAKAFDWIRRISTRKPASISGRDLLTIHELILSGIDDANAGCYRSVPVRISGSMVVLPNPRKVPDLMRAFVRSLHSSKKLHPVAYAAMAHYELVTIHPFVDGNGRTARLLMNLLLMMRGYPPAIIRKEERLLYINSLEKAQLGGSQEDYLKLIVKAVDRSLTIYLKAARGEGAEAPKPAPKLLKIGALAKAVGETVPTIRHWTQEGLLDVAELTESGYQLYAPEMIGRIKRIQAMKGERLTLGEIKQRIAERPEPRPYVPRRISIEQWERDEPNRIAIRDSIANLFDVKMLSRKGQKKYKAEAVRAFKR